MPMKLSDMECLTGKFFIFSRRGWWKVECMQCEAKWRLEKKPDLHTGNLLHLLNHAASHDASLELIREVGREMATGPRSADNRRKAQAVNKVLNDWMRKQL